MMLHNREYSEPELKAYIHKLEDILRELRPVLKAAIYANYKETNKANELYDKITKIVGKE